MAITSDFLKAADLEADCCVTAINPDYLSIPDGFMERLLELKNKDRTLSEDVELQTLEDLLLIESQMAGLYLMKSLTEEK